MLSGSRYDVEESAGPRIGPRIRRGDHALAFDRIEVGRRRLTGQTRAGFVRAAAEPEQPAHSMPQRDRRRIATG